MNAAKVLWSFYRSRWSGNPEMSGFPVALSIEPTTSCNLRCPECPSGLRSFSRPTGMLEEALFRKIIDEVSHHIMYLTLYFQGEPLLHPRFIELVQYASDQGIFTATSTNGHHLNRKMAERIVQSGLGRLIISIDGTTQEVYEQYRIGGSLNKVLEGTGNLLAARTALQSSTPEVIYQFLVVAPNENQTGEVKNLGKSLGVDAVWFKTAQVYDYEHGNPLIPSQTKYSRYRKTETGHWQIKNPLQDHCWKMWHSCVITWDGKVVPCCFDKDAKHALGDLQKNSLQDIWHGADYRHFRSRLLQSRKEIDICSNCSEGSPVWI